MATEWELSGAKTVVVGVSSSRVQYSEPHLRVGSGSRITETDQPELGSRW